jgi:glycosyltransferase involved in cell wall biosynthesis
MRVLFLNDLGFQYGAGIAEARQIQSLLIGGHLVGAVCGADGGIGDGLLFTRPDIVRDRWRGMRTLETTFRRGRSEAEQADAVLTAIARFYPDVVVAGNMHGGWPLSLLSQVRRLGCRVVSYLHDLNLVTGRCTYPGPCTAYLSGCTVACPTASEYPALEPTQIFDAWALRRSLFAGPDGIELATNSRYLRALAQSAIPTASVSTMYLGADETLYAPGDRADARRQLGLPLDRPIVLTGAVNLTDRRKGAHHLPVILERIGDRALVVAFGYQGHDALPIHALGYETDPYRQALAYRAADLFLGTASEEAFGQTILEAGLSGIPCVAFNTGGIPEIVESGETGVLVAVGDVEALADAVCALLGEDDRRSAWGRAARVHTVERFSLARQLEGWTALLDATVLERPAA